MLGAVSLLAAACSGGAPATGSLAGAVSSVDSVESATIQIIAEGAFVDPEIGEYEGAGAGSGFIIDPSGIAVTNNHVVTGSALLQVHVPGRDEPVNAKILGVSECSDLAVIDLDGEGYPFLTWYEGEVTTGLEVFSAGYPLGDPEFTLTKGIVSKADYDIETEWASVDSVIEHDARIRGGNSGGPVVTADAKVVGVNYAGSSETDQNLAIHNSEARRVIEQLQQGIDVTAIGINGVGVTDGESISGVWVQSVESGSPADTAGIRGGDILTRLESVALAEDGTLARYCDILRGRNASDVMRIEVLRFATSEILEGQLNGDELVQSFSFAQEVGETPASGGGGVGGVYSGYTVIQDDTGSISIEVPVEWGDVDGAPFTDDDGNEVFDLRASPDLEAFQSGWATPGVIVSASAGRAQTTDEIASMDQIQAGLAGTCVYEGRSDYDDPYYTGAYDLYSDCGGTGATYLVLGAAPPDRSYLILIQVQAVSDADYEVLDHILNTFTIGG